MSIFYIFAGNNGSGKSSFRQQALDGFYSEVDIDNDAIVRNMKQQNIRNPLKEAGKETIRIFNNCIEKKVNFSIETTLSSKLILKQIKTAKENGYKVVMYYLLLSDVKLNINRVKYRHQQGGHFIPTEDIIRRHKRSRDNLLKIKNEIDQLFIIDNSQRESHLIATLEKGTIIYTDDNYTDLLNSNLKL